MSAVERTAAVIFSHGLCESSVSWSFLADQLGSKMPWVKWVFPNAPVQPVTLKKGKKVPAWFDIFRLTPDSKEDKNGILNSVETMKSLIQKEVQAGIPTDRIIVGGFSQGGVISIPTGLMNPDPLAGVICLSGFLPLKDEIKERQGPHTSKLNVFWGHGTHDPVVHYEWGVKSVEFLKENLGVRNVEFKSYSGVAHNASPAELQDLADWLLIQIPKI